MALVVKHTFLEFQCSEYDLDMKSYRASMPFGRSARRAATLPIKLSSHISDEETDFAETESESGLSGRSRSEDWGSPDALETDSEDEVETGDIAFCTTKTYASADDEAQEMMSPPMGATPLPCHAFTQSSVTPSQGCPMPMDFAVASPIFVGCVGMGEVGYWAWTNITTPTSFRTPPASQSSAQKQEIPDQQEESVQSADSEQEAKSSRKKVNRLPAEYHANSPNGSVKEEDWTTVMVRNIPNNYTREMLLDLFDSQGLAGHYDFVYLPVDFKRDSSLGYAFVNLSSNEGVKLIQEKLEGFTDWAIPTEKVCEIGWSKPLQGLKAHLDRYRNSPVMHEDVPEKYKPLYFIDGKNVPMPPSTKKLRAPRGKRNVSENCKDAES